MDPSSYRAACSRACTGYFGMHAYGFQRWLLHVHPQGGSPVSERLDHHCSGAWQICCPAVDRPPLQQYCYSGISNYCKPAVKHGLRNTTSAQRHTCLIRKPQCHNLCDSVQDYETVAAVHREGSASPRTTIGAAAQQQHSRAPSEIARTELAGSLSSRSSASQGSDCRWVFTPACTAWLTYWLGRLASLMPANHISWSVAVSLVG